MHINIKTDSRLFFSRCLKSFHRQGSRLHVTTATSPTISTCHSYLEETIPCPLQRPSTTNHPRLWHANKNNNPKYTLRSIRTRPRTTLKIAIWTWDLISKSSWSPRKRTRNKITYCIRALRFPASTWRYQQIRTTTQTHQQVLYPHILRKDCCHQTINFLSSIRQLIPALLIYLCTTAHRILRTAPLLAKISSNLPTSKRKFSFLRPRIQLSASKKRTTCLLAVLFHPPQAPTPTIPLLNKWASCQKHLTFWICLIQALLTSR